MTTESDPRTRTVVSWLREDAHENAERVLLAALNDIDHTQQRRSWWPARRFPAMNTFAKVLVATAAVVAVAVMGINLLPGSQTGAGGPPPASPSAPPSSPSPSPSPTPQPTASLVTHTLTPFGPDGFRFTFDAPASWEQFEGFGVWIDGNAPFDGAALFIYGTDIGLYSDPCLPEDGDPDIAVGPTVDDLVTALVDHPSLDVTSPVDVTLAGYSGTYLDLLVPDDISACAFYQPMDGHFYAQGPSHRWHMWVLDVGGDRVLVETNDYAGTSAQRLAEEQAMIDSLVITP